MLKICKIPEFNPVWTDLDVSQYFESATNDFHTCWKGKFNSRDQVASCCFCLGMGYNACSNQAGYWHYPDMPGCQYWADSLPQELLDETDPIKSLVRDQTNVLFSSK